MKYFYSASAMGFHGEGYWWHKPFEKLFDKLPDFPFVTKTITQQLIKATPWRMFFIPCFLKSTWNRIGLHNPGYTNWILALYDLGYNNGSYVPRMIPSLAGSDDDIQWMLNDLSTRGFKFDMVELNFSCPNIIHHENKKIPDTKYPLSLKLNADDSPFKYDLHKGIKRITLNSIPTGKWYRGAYSGKLAQKKNWWFIDYWMNEMKHIQISIAGCSITCMDDIKKLEAMGCEEIGLGSIVLTNPWLVRKLKND